jgi:AcrR family transcriptional regulator
MPAKRKAMRKIKEVLRLKFETGFSHERIAAAVGVSKGAVTKYVQRAVAAGLGWPLAPELDDAALEALLFPHSPALVAAYAPPDYALIHQELKRKGVTLQLLWEEYSADHPGGAYVARWLADMDARCALARYFAPPLTDLERAMAEREV